MNIYNFKFKFKPSINPVSFDDVDDVTTSSTYINEWHVFIEENINEKHYNKSFGYQNNNLYAC